MYEITFQFENGAQEVHFSAAPGSTILEAAKAANVAIDAPCNGNGSCGKCRVKLVSGELTGPQTSHISDEEYADGWRLSCCMHAASDAVVLVPDIASAYRSRMKVADLSSPEEIAIFETLRQKLVDAGNSVVVIEHNLDVIKTADYVIDMGPDGGDRGGTVVAEGTPEEVAKVENSYTGQFLKDILAREGRLDGTRVWRAPVLHDSRVFLRKDEESRAGFTVDLMLDASASRLHCQESIAIQGYLLAKSLASCGIPVRVTSFCSLRGYTVLRVLKDFGDKNGERRVFDYFAAGWNRDGLALRAAGELMKSAPADKHLLILLTDASPDDSRKILPTGKVPLSRSYDGEAGVQDTAEEVRALRQQGVRVAAVFMGENASAPDARTIYGQDLVRIQRMDQLATAAGKLIQEEIRELSG